VENVDRLTAFRRRAETNCDAVYSPCCRPSTTPKDFTTSCHTGVVSPEGWTRQCRLAQRSWRWSPTGDRVIFRSTVSGRSASLWWQCRRRTASVRRRHRASNVASGTQARTVRIIQQCIHAVVNYGVITSAKKIMFSSAFTLFVCLLTGLQKKLPNRFSQTRWKGGTWATKKNN